MKKQLLILLLVSGLITSFGQMPLPCVRYANGSDLEGFQGQMEVNCLTIDLGQNSYTIADDNYRGFEVNYATIEPGSNGENTGIQITPGDDPDSGFQISLREADGGDDELAGAWFEPSDSYNVPLYEKAEWGMILPATIETAIDNWIYNDENPGSNLTPALNPFDPDQIDLWAEITIGGTTKRLNGFFYIPFERNTSNPDKNYWDWDELPNDYRFRFRYSPETIGFHFITVHCNVPGYGTWEHVPFVFNATWNDPRKSFVSVTPNGHYFQTVDGHVIMPIGINLNDMSYGCECELINSDDCNECYSKGQDDICCGLSDGFRHHRYNDGIPQTDAKLMRHCFPLVSYIKRDMILEELKNKGATAVRMWNDASGTDIEYEKLTNYYERQYQGWEVDKAFEKCHELGLRIEWCQLTHFMITNNSYYAERSDWGNLDKCGYLIPDDPGYCYFQEFGEDTAVDFFSDPAALQAYKKKLRYMMARWGYSSEIFLIDLVSETNNVDDGNAYNCTDTNQNGQWDVGEPLVEIDEALIENPYQLHQNNIRSSVAAWHHEVAKYIKTELGGNRHLLSADYAGPAPMNDTSTPCDDSDYDYSWQSPYIDVIAFSYYDQSSNRYETMARKGYENLWCSGTFTESGIIGGQIIPHYTGIPKPVVFAECGMTGFMECDHTQFIKELLAGCLTGHATAGMGWMQLKNSTYWYMMENVNDFLQTYLLNTHNIGIEEWRPGHAFSVEDNSTWNNENNKRVEAVYLQRINTPESPKFVGVIMNRTWNFYTVNGTQCGAGNDDLGYEYEKVQTIAEVGWGNEKIHISNADNAEYTIRYYDPYDLDEVNEVINNTSDETLDLEDYPLMFDGTSGHHPFYFFVAFKEGSEWDQMPDYSSLSHTENSRFESAGDISAKVIENSKGFESASDFIHGIQIFPNPTNSIVTILSSAESEYKIIDSTGAVVCQGSIKSGKSDLDLGALSNGIFLIQFLDFDYQQKLIKVE